MRKIVIIGNGISGITCARHIRKQSNDSITIISSETEHFFSRTALMYLYMGHMKFDNLKPYEDFFWKKNKLDLVFDEVLSVNGDDKYLSTKSNNIISFDILIIATGSVTKKYNWPGQELNGVAGFYSYSDLVQIQKETVNIKSAVVAGGGLIGVELAEMLHSKNIHVTLLVRDKFYWASVLPETDAKFVGAHIEKHGVQVLYNKELREIIADNTGNVSHVITQDEELIQCSFVGISTGVTPNIAFLKNSNLEVEKGILVDEYFQTNYDHIYAIGDCAQLRDAPIGRKSIEQIWYTGRMHGETLAQTICGKKTKYQPGPFFNSAKFFDLEYQTYGIVPARLSGTDMYYSWHHPNKEILITIVYDAVSFLFKGINCFGTRLRHQYFDAKLKDHAVIQQVLAHFNEAIFDKEFEKNYVPLLIKDFCLVSGINIQIQNKSFSI